MFQNLFLEVKLRWPVLDSKHFKWLSHLADTLLLDLQVSLIVL